jgi:hypothetical protein
VELQIAATPALPRYVKGLVLQPFPWLSKAVQAYIAYFCLVTVLPDLFPFPSQYTHIWTCECDGSDALPSPQTTSPCLSFYLLPSGTLIALPSLWFLPFPSMLPPSHIFPSYTYNRPLVRPDIQASRPVFSPDLAFSRL